MLGLLEFCCESTSFWWLQNLSIFREWDRQQPSMGLWLELWLCENQCWVHHIRDHGDFINSCTDVQEGDRSWQKSQDFQTQTLNQTHQFHLFTHLMFFSIILQFLYIIFCFESISIVKKTLQQLKKLFRNTSPHTFALWTPTQESFPYQPHSTTQIFFLFCFVLAKWWWPLMMAFLLKP
jgi:hypothetical protein